MQVRVFQLENVSHTTWSSSFHKFKRTNIIFFIHVVVWHGKCKMECNRSERYGVRT